MKILMLLLCVAFSLSTSAQKIYKGIPPVGGTVTFEVEVDGSLKQVTLSPDSTIHAIRPIANLVGYAEPGNVLQTGVGISWQSLTWNSTTQKWYSNYSVSGLIWYGTPTGSSSIGSASYGFTVGILNNIILLGPAYNPALKKVQVIVGIGISLN